MAYAIAPARGTDAGTISDLCTEAALGTHARWVEPRKLTAWLRESYGHAAVVASIACASTEVFAARAADGTLAGTCRAELGSFELLADARVSGLYLSPGARGHGLASRLLDAALTWLEDERQARTVLAVTAQPNARARELFRRNAFVLERTWTGDASAPLAWCSLVRRGAAAHCRKDGPGPPG